MLVNTNRETGTTAVTLLLLDEYIIVSNVGDSEAVVCRDGKAVQLSILHTPLNEDEKKRVGKLRDYVGNTPFTNNYYSGCRRNNSVLRPTSCQRYFSSYTFHW